MSLNGLVLIIIIINGGLLTYTRLRRTPDTIKGFWLSVTLAMGIVNFLSLLVPSTFEVGDKFGKDFIITLSSIGVLTVFGWFVLYDVSSRKPIRRLREFWFGINAIWFVLVIVSTLFSPTPFEGWRDIVQQTPNAPFVVSISGLLLAGSILTGVCSYTFYIAPLPEISNRSGYWMIVITAVITSMVLLTSGADLLRFVGSVSLLVCFVATTYAVYHHRLVDVRMQFLNSLQWILFLITTWALILGTTYLIARIDIGETPASTVGLALLSLFVATILMPTHQLLNVIFKVTLQSTRPSLAVVTAEYSRNVALAPDLEAVIKATNETLCDTMQIRKAALILINNTYKRKDAVELIVLETGATMRKPTTKGFLSKKSPIFQSLAVNKVPLGQFDIEHGLAYRSVIAEERAFFGKLGMHAFVPIVAETNLIGLLACGSKLNDLAYTREDLELLTVIGQQVGNALRNARLIDDLKHLNGSMRDLNKRLEDAKVELEKMDNIKTDFVTIASHELRTPLAQIRGYTDILDSLNEGGALQKPQASQMVANLRKSTERMEELIGAMLDVSQLDVNSMDLRFVRTTPETVVRMALDPLLEAIEQRNQTIERNGLAGLPYVQADMQRIVQAFRNIFLNAIKYTPDGGKIDITATLEKKPDGKDTILFAIKDTGIGVAEKDRELIFHKFYRGFDTQLHSTGMTKFLGAGPGLGLTITKGIVEGHGGEIWVESSGQNMTSFPGSTFYVRLPILPPKGQRVSLPFDEAQIPDNRRKTSTIQVVSVQASEDTSLTKTAPEETAKNTPTSSTE